MLLIAALVEVVVNRCAVPMLRPMIDAPPDWHTALDYIGLFVQYFTGALAVMVMIARCVAAIDGEGRNLRDMLAAVALGVAALVATAPLLVSVPTWTSFLLEIMFFAAVIAVVASVFGRERDLGVQVGLPLVALPLGFHTVTVIVTELCYPDDAFNAPGGPGPLFLKIAVMLLAVAALATPYCFAPRPFARAVARPIPIIVAMGVAALGAVVARLWYGTLAAATNFAIGIRMSPDADRKLALYLLAIATLAWTLTSCLLAGSKARRMIGMGIAFVVLGGFEFHWPHHYLLPLLGLALIAEAAREVREEELEAMPFVLEAPPISDQVWSTYIGAVAQGLRRTLADVHSVTTRGDHDLASSVIIASAASAGAGDAGGLPVRARIERYGGCVVALDVVIGREVDEVRGSTFTVWAMPPRGAGVNPPGPPAAPIFKTGDAPFDAKFRTRGNAIAFGKLFDDDARARAIMAFDGWLAYWEKDGLRYRVYPGRGAPIDHPMPLSDLALGRVNPNVSDRLVGMIELLVELGSRGLEPSPKPPEPSELPDEVS